MALAKLSALSYMPGMANEPRKIQVNIRVDQDFLDAIATLRAAERPIPTATEVIIKAVLEAAKREAQRRR